MDSHPNFHPNSPLSRSNSAVHVAISTWPKRNRALAVQPEVEEARLVPPSITKIREIRGASNTLSFLPLSIVKLAGTGGRKAFAPWKWNAAEIADVFSVRRVARPEVGPAGQKSWSSRIRDEEFFRRSACSTRASRKLKFLFRLQIFVVSVSISIEGIDDGGGFEFRGKISDLFYGWTFWNFCYSSCKTRLRFRIIDNWDRS